MLLLIRLVQACVFAVFGKIYATWFMKTKAGKWLMNKVENFMQYLADKYEIEIAKKEVKWKRDYPELAKRLEKIENNISWLSGDKGTSRDE